MKKSIVAAIILSAFAVNANAADQWSAIFGDVQNAMADHNNTARAGEILHRRAGVELSNAQVSALFAHMQERSITQFDVIEDVVAKVKTTSAAAVKSEPVSVDVPNPVFESHVVYQAPAVVVEATPAAQVTNVEKTEAVAVVAQPAPAKVTTVQNVAESTTVVDVPNPEYKSHVVYQAPAVVVEATPAPAAVTTVQNVTETAAVADVAKPADAKPQTPIASPVIAVEAQPAPAAVTTVQNVTETAAVAEVKKPAPVKTEVVAPASTVIVDVPNAPEAKPVEVVKEATTFVKEAAPAQETKTEAPVEKSVTKNITKNVTKNVNKTVSKTVTQNVTQQTITNNTYVQTQVVADVQTQKLASYNSHRIGAQESRLAELESNTNKRFGELKSQVDSNKKAANAGIAGVAAMATIPQVLESQKFNVGVGAGSHDGESAMAVGFSARVSQNVVTKASVAADTQDGFTVAAGLAVGW